MKLNKVRYVLIVILLATVFLNTGCTQADKSPDQHLLVDRESKIPDDAVKVTPETDLNPVKSYSDEYYDPAPLPYPINTAGAEDSAFILPDGKTLYFWFTPDVRVPPERQILDGVTGIYVSHKKGDSWTEPERVWLNDPGKLSLDGCGYIKDNEIWFCSAREGYPHSGYGSGLNWFKAEFDNSLNIWKNWRLIKFPIEYEVGELHIHENEIYYHSNRLGGKGGMDIWVITIKSDGTWSNPRNIEINTERDEGFPALSLDGTELWFTRDYAIWRSKKVDGRWTEPEKMFSPLAGEASIDKYGNVYFTHHFFEGHRMIEADIYVAYKKN